MELSPVGRYNGQSNSNYYQSFLPSRSLNIKQVAVGAITLFGTAIFFGTEKTLGIPAKIGVATLIISSGLGLCYLLRSKTEDSSEDVDTSDSQESNISLESEIGTNTVVNLQNQPEHLTPSPKLEVVKPVDPRYIQLNEEQEIQFHQLCIDYCSFVIGVRPQSDTITFRTQLENLYATLNKDQTILLCHAEKFWNILTDPEYVKTISHFLSAENFEILAEYCVHHAHVGNVIAINKLLAYLNLNLENLDIQSKKLAIANYENKLIAIAISGHPGIDEKIFKGKVLMWLPNKNKIFDIWGFNRQRVSASWDKTGILSRKPSINNIERSNSVSSNPGNWPTQEIELFIKNVIEANDESQFSKIETMDETSLKILIRKISLPTTLESYWNLEAKMAETSIVTKMKLERLLTILKTLAEVKIKTSAKFDSFWQALSENVKGYTFTAEQKVSPVNAIFNFKNFLSEKIKKEF